MQKYIAVRILVTYGSTLLLISQIKMPLTPNSMPSTSSETLKERPDEMQTLDNTELGRKGKDLST